MDVDIDFDSLVNLEQGSVKLPIRSGHWFINGNLHRFFDEGYKDGHAHGRIHGLIEGRALGREKGYEMWEELGFYEGFAVTWGAILVKLGKADECVHLKQRPFTGSVSYPRKKAHHINGLLSLIAQFPQTNPSPRSVEEGEVDILKLLRQIRSKYKLLCAILGVRTRVHSATEAESGAGEMEAEAESLKKKPKPSIWEVQPAEEDVKISPARQDLSL
jgi:Essential protein Yae1, N terminal